MASIPLLARIEAFLANRKILQDTWDIIAKLPWTLDPLPLDLTPELKQLAAASDNKKFITVEKRLERYLDFDHVIGENGEPSPDSRQMDEEGKVIESFLTLYDLGEKTKPVFENLIREALKSKGLSPDFLVPADLKPMKRAKEKAHDDYGDRAYGPGLSWLFDIVRATVVFPSCASLCTFTDALLALQFPQLHSLRFKNRFVHPTSGGHRDFLVLIICHVSDTLEYICELQLQLEPLYETNQHYDTISCYKNFRRYFDGTQALVNIVTRESITNRNSFSNGNGNGNGNGAAAPTSSKRRSKSVTIGDKGHGHVFCPTQKAAADFLLYMQKEYQRFLGPRGATLLYSSHDSCINFVRLITEQVIAANDHSLDSCLFLLLRMEEKREDDLEDLSSSADFHLAEADKAVYRDILLHFLRIKEQFDIEQYNAEPKGSDVPDDVRYRKLYLLESTRILADVLIENEGGYEEGARLYEKVIQGQEDMRFSDLSESKMGAFRSSADLTKIRLDHAFPAPATVPSTSPLAPLLSDAIEYYGRVLNFFVFANADRFGPIHSTTLDVKMKLGSLLCMHEQNVSSSSPSSARKKGMQLLTEAVQGFEAIFGSEEKESINAAEALATAAYRMGDLTSAQQYYDHALTSFHIIEEELSKKPGGKLLSVPEVLQKCRIQELLAGVCERLGLKAEAEELMHEATEVRNLIYEAYVVEAERQSLGSRVSITRLSSPDPLGAKAAAENGEHNGAGIEPYQDINSESTLGASDVLKHEIDNLFSLGVSGELDLQAFEEMVPRAEGVLGEAHPDTLDVKFHVALMLAAGKGTAGREGGDLARARDLFKNVLDWRLTTLPANHPDVTIVRTNLAIVSADLGDFHTAYDQFLASHTALSEQPTTTPTEEANKRDVYKSLLAAGTASGYDPLAIDSLPVYLNSHPTHAPHPQGSGFVKSFNVHSVAGFDCGVCNYYHMGWRYRCSNCKFELCLDCMVRGGPP